MDIMSWRTTSSLNPNAPLFVPWAYRTVKDFSYHWWELVQTSPWFCDYWLLECFQEPSQQAHIGTTRDLGFRSVCTLGSQHGFNEPTSFSFIRLWWGFRQQHWGSRQTSA
uniref:Uncharacterized protein n=1 Tax=Nelumbo nucifera TaxID=4432 RepID=A0A822YEI3_NELNU|nr:TPA_asm: hypothetical protein HUJ06_030843 [Nelumbo nucifera]